MQTNAQTRAPQNKAACQDEPLPVRPVLRHRSGLEGIIVAILLCSLFLVVSHAADLGQARMYQSGFTVVLKLGGDLSQSLPEKFGNQIDPQAIALEPEESPVVTPIITTEDNGVQRQVSLSAGFIDLLNHICHARAVDNIEPGYFDHYIKILAQSADDGMAQPPSIVDPRYWTDDVINDQMSYFNQMVGFIMALNLSHLYLGHYAKYSSRMVEPGEKIIPINLFLTSAEWEVSVRAAAVDSLNCALATDGSRALFEAIGKMPNRPAWAAYVLPAHVDIKKLNHELMCYEKDFFRGQLK